jgi:uncharacterized protein involved in response to NO
MRTPWREGHDPTSAFITVARPPDTARAAARWRAEHLLDVPHRLRFFWAGVSWAAAAAGWAALLVAATLGMPWPWQPSAASAHGLWFSLGAMPLFIAGFMFTAGPRWLRRPPISARPLRPPMGLFIAGWGVAVAGFHRAPTLAAAGLALSSPRLASGRTGLIQPLLRVA